MTGSHHIVIETPRLKYEFTIRRNLTIIQGDSATGKTTLIDLLSEYARGGHATSIRLTSDAPCVVYSAGESDWKILLTSYTGSLIFIDEGYSFIRSKEFAEAIRQTDNYYILITREALPNLPYSINEIYGIRTSGKYHFPEQIYHEFYPVYEDITLYSDNDVSATYIVTEDSSSGYLFLCACCSDSPACISSNGNTGIYKTLRDLPRGKIAVIADGAAFGAYISRVLSLIQYRKDTFLFLPESFEWIVLKSGVVKDAGLKDILAAPEEYIDSKTFFSWEQFFTQYLRRITADDPVRRYGKEYLSDYYTTGRTRERILNVYPDAIRSCIEDLVHRKANP